MWLDGGLCAQPVWFLCECFCVFLPWAVFSTWFYSRVTQLNFYYVSWSPNVYWNVKQYALQKKIGACRCFPAFILFVSPVNLRSHMLGFDSLHTLCEMVMAVYRQGDVWPAGSWVKASSGSSAGLRSLAELPAVGRLHQTCHMVRGDTLSQGTAFIFLDPSHHLRSLPLGV